MTPRYALLLPAFFLFGCAKGDLMHAAASGDRARVATLVSQHDKAGSLGNGEAEDVALATILRELQSGKREIVAGRIPLLYACAREAQAAISKMAESHDEAGAKAALLLVDAGAKSPSSFDADLSDPLEGFRAVAARGLTSKGDGKERRVALNDPSPLVRRAGIRAAREAEDDDDLPLLRDRARLDPAAEVRSEAVRALLHHPKERLEEIVRHVEGTDDTTRAELATAFATTRAAEGGSEELRRLLATAPTRMSSLLGALFFVRGNHPKDDATSELANSVVVETLRRGGRVERLTAIRLAPLDPPFRSEIENAASTGDREIMLAAWSRLLELPAREKDAVAMLFRFAGNDYGRLSSEARLRLAERGHREVQAWVEQDLEVADPERHALAIRALGKLDRVARAARLLGREDANVRLRAACAMLSAH